MDLHIGGLPFDRNNKYRLGLTMCSKGKMMVPCSGIQMYSPSTYWRLKWGFLLDHTDLSAMITYKSGLISGDDTISPYDYPVDNLSQEEHDEGCRRIAEDLSRIDADPIISMVSEKYLDGIRWSGHRFTNITGRFGKLMAFAKDNTSSPYTTPLSKKSIRTALEIVHSQGMVLVKDLARLLKEKGIHERIEGIVHGIQVTGLVGESGGVIGWKPSVIVNTMEKDYCPEVNMNLGIREGAYV